MNSNSFYTSNVLYSCPKNIQESLAIKKKLLIIDALGFEDTQRNNQTNIDKIINLIKKKRLNAIIILFNFHQTRLFNLLLKAKMKILKLI